MDRQLATLSESYRAAWDQYVDRHPGSTFYHSSKWLRLLEETFGYKQRSLLLLEGNRVVGVLPLLQVNGIVGKRLVSSPFRDRGGVLVDADIDPMILCEEAISLCRSGRYRHLLIKQGDPLRHADVERCRLIERKYWVTTTIDLSVGAECIWKKLKNNAQGPVKQASKQGIHVQRCCDEQGVEVFYDLFLENRRSLGTPAFPRAFFTGIWRAFDPGGKAVLMLAYKENTVLGGILLLVHNQTVIDGYAASRTEYRGYRPNDLLVWKAIEWAAGNGYRIFDFGADSPKQNHLLAFKRKWTGIHRSMHHYVYLHKDRTYMEMDNSNERYRKIRSGIAKMPKPVFRIFSDLTVARFG